MSRVFEAVLQCTVLNAFDSHLVITIITFLDVSVALEPAPLSQARGL